MTRRDVLAVSGAMIAAATLPAAALPKPKPLVFAHRGASALRPEHTLGAYARAIADGADYIEPDLVLTRDGVLVARHENNIADTTDVAAHPQFAARKTLRMIDGVEQSGWFTEDFSLTELKSLRAKERLGALRGESASYDGAFQILTFDEIIDFTAAEAAARGQVIGLVPELKHSSYFAARGTPLEPGFVTTLAAHAYTRRAPVEIQSFETANLRALRATLGRPDHIKLLQLIDDPAMQPADLAAAGSSKTYAAMLTRAGLAEIASYADVVAPQLRRVIPLSDDGTLAPPTTLVRDAHDAGLLLRVWTFRPENHFLAPCFRGPGGDAARHEAGALAEISAYLAAGIDGFFTDDPALGRRAVDAMVR